MFSNFRFHSQDKKDGDSSKTDYRSQFEDLLGKHASPISKEEQDFINRQVEAKRVMDEEAQRKVE